MGKQYSAASTLDDSCWIGRGAEIGAVRMIAVFGALLYASSNGGRVLRFNAMACSTHGKGGLRSSRPTDA